MTTSRISASVAAHIHTHLDSPESGCQGRQSLLEAAISAHEAGYDGLVFTPHTTDPGPGRPHAFGDDDQLTQALLAYNQEVRLLQQRSDHLTLFTGVEANLLPSGLDAPAKLLEDCDLVIASLHGTTPTVPDQAVGRFSMACHYDHIDVLGHPQRYLESVEVPWDDVFKMAAHTNTAVEINYNVWHTYGVNRARRKGDRDGALWHIGYHYEWLRLLAQSGAPALFSLDVHEAGMWPQSSPAADWMPTTAQVEEYLKVMTACGIRSDHIINRSPATLREWVDTPKTDRWRLLP